jgi:hypothetical protein
LREAFLELLFRSCELAGATLVFVSHDRQLMPLFSSSVSLPEINRLSETAETKRRTPPESRQRSSPPRGEGTQPWV